MSHFHWILHYCTKIKVELRKLNQDPARTQVHCLSQLDLFTTFSFTDVQKQIFNDRNNFGFGTLDERAIKVPSL